MLLASVILSARMQDVLQSSVSYVNSYTLFSAQCSTRFRSTWALQPTVDMFKIKAGRIKQPKPYSLIGTQLRLCIGYACSLGLLRIHNDNAQGHL